MSRPGRSALSYLIAVLVPTMLIPVLTGETWPGIETTRPFAAYVLFLCISIIGRFLGFRPALLCTVASTIALWRVLLTTVHPLPVSVVRLLLFSVSSVVVVSISRQRSKEVGEAEERYRSLFDTAIDAILFVDANGRYIDANPAATALLGYSWEELTERSMGDFSRIEDRSRLMEIFDRLMKEGRASGENVVVRKDGSTREVEYRSAANAPPGVHCVMLHDITARKEAERSLHNLSGKLLQLQDEERRRIARQLHDTTAQSLAAIRLNLTRISRLPEASSGVIKEALDESVDLTDQSIVEIRTLSYLLHPPLIDEAGLLASLRWFVRGFGQRSGIRATLDVADDIGRLPRDVETAVFRIVQEALTNIQRHSGSAAAGIRLERHRQCLHLEVEDEGHGMPQDLRDHPNAMLASGVGIAGIQERVRELGGQMEIQSHDRGTRLAVNLPIAEA